jgi:hypothetical protein
MATSSARILAARSADDDAPPPPPARWLDDEECRNGGAPLVIALYVILAYLACEVRKLHPPRRFNSRSRPLSTDRPPVDHQFLVLQRVDWNGSDDAGRGAIPAWARVVVATLPALVLAGLWLVHYSDPGVIPPRRDGDAPDVTWFLGAFKTKVFHPLSSFNI